MNKFIKLFITPFLLQSQFFFSMQNSSLTLPNNEETKTALGWSNLPQELRHIIIEETIINLIQNRQSIKSLNTKITSLKLLNKNCLATIKIILSSKSLTNFSQRINYFVKNPISSYALAGAILDQTDWKNYSAEYMENANKLAKELYYDCIKFFCHISNHEVESQNSAIKIYEKIKENIALGANMNYVNLAQHETALTYASFFDNTSLLRLLINGGANLDICNSRENTALMHASYLGFTNIVRILIDAGCNLNSQNRYGDTALMLSTLQGYLDISKLLINNGADTNLQNCKGQTALIFAVKKYSTNIIRALLKASNTNVHLKNKYNKSALDYAKNQPELLKILNKF